MQGQRDSGIEQDMEVPPCTKCGSPSIIFQRYSGLHLCKKHFIEDVERKVKRRIRKKRMIEQGDKIAIALSGGKDSSALLILFKKITKMRRDVELVAISVDEGIAEYRPKTLERAKSLADKLNVPHIIRSFEDVYGNSLDELVKKAEKKYGLMGGCSLCGVLRKRLLNSISREIGATKLAVGHNLDDEAQTILMNYLRGDVERLLRLSPRKEREEFIPRIKPLVEVPEKEVALYSLLHGVEIEHEECPYASESYRFDVRDFLNYFEMGHPGTKYSLLRGYEKLIDMIGVMDTLPKEFFELSSCVRCGEPTSGKMCKVCEILEKLGT